MLLLEILADSLSVDITLRNITDDQVHCKKKKLLENYSTGIGSYYA